MTRLLVFPHAGGNAASFNPWLKLLPPDISPVPIHLPGRGLRFAEPPIDDLDRLIELLLDELEPELDAPFALFGHSMGALIGFEFARALRRRGQTPTHLFASARQAPQLERTRPKIHDLPEERFVSAILNYDATPPSLLDPCVRNVFLPALRADFRLLETYRYRAAPPLDCPLIVLHGTEDSTVSTDGAKAWCEHSSRPMRLLAIQGGHFFVTEQPHEVANIVAKVILGDASQSRPGDHLSPLRG